MTHLLVAVPAALADLQEGIDVGLKLTDPHYVVPLHQRLVERLRNAEAHTYSDVDERDAQFLFRTCSEWLADMRMLWGVDVEVGKWIDPKPPSLDDLLQLMRGDARSSQDALNSL